MSNNHTSPDIERAMAEALESVERLERGKDEAKAAARADTEPEVEVEAQAAEEAGEGEAAEATVEDITGLKDQLLRLAADFENFRKRARREREEQRQFAAENVLRSFLPVLDNLERALSHGAEEDDPVAQGVRLVAKQFRDVLASHGVKGFDSVGEAFDPERHEAMGRQPSDEAAPGSVVVEMEKGYMLHTRLLRPAKVIVAAAPESDSTEHPGDESR